MAGLANNAVDSGLLDQIRQDDEQAFGRLYARYHKPLLSFVQKIVRTKSDAEDLVQEVFMTLWNRRQTLDPQRNVGALIFVIARRAAVDYYRRAEREGGTVRAEIQETVESIDLSPQQLLEQNETRMLLDIAIARMSRRQREIFSLYYYDHLSPEQIAVHRGLSYENVRKQIYTAKKYLREIITLIALFLSLENSSIGG